eukprot:TRINITY_DN5617_c0_g3_i1.p1 TRINITY_DN5617_c0_g3~~TRINITY_DN5617_c0_g3_i1.p1  ORF type:complete len:660 (+),score=105.48 TRINITY_DN5617_c0_g3_i1:177-1982(+)
MSKESRSRLSAEKIVQSEGRDTASKELSNHTMSKVEFDQLKRWQQELVHYFGVIDKNEDGTVNLQEFLALLRRYHVPKARVTKFLVGVDADQNGCITFEEWLHAIKEIEPKELQLLSVGLTKGVTFSEPEDDSMMQWSMLHPLSKRSLAWSCLMITVCLFLALIQPFELAFSYMMSEDALANLRIIDYTVDCIFILDMIVNFRTGYISQNNAIILEWRLVALHYLRTWFLCDLVSILPFDAMTGGVGVLTGMRMLKILKLIKLTKSVHVANRLAAHAMDHFVFLEELIQLQWVRFVYRRGNVFLFMVLMCHWMACVMKFVDHGFLANYQDVGGSVRKEYVAAIYWSMTTLTTVGYGDITASSDMERIYSVIAMFLGTSFYGYIIGSISAMIAQKDVNNTAYFQRMDLVYAWVTHHKLPKDLGLTVCRHFRHMMSERTAISEDEVWHDLSPELQKEVGEFVVHEFVKCNPIFDGIALSAVVRLQSILVKFTVFSGLTITDVGDVGSAMYIIEAGAVSLSLADMADEEKEHVRTLKSGASFGEETLFGLKEYFEYSTVALETTKIVLLLEEKFRNVFQDMPQAWARMYQNAQRLNNQIGRAHV